MFRKLSFAAMLLATLSCPLFLGAQPVKAAGVEALIEQLELNERQADSLREIEKDYAAAQKKVRKANKSQKEHLLADLGIARANRERAILGLLTDAQRDQYLDIRDAEKADMRRRHRPRKSQK